MKRLLSLALALLLLCTSACAGEEKRLTPFTLAQYQAFSETLSAFYPLTWLEEESGAVLCDASTLCDVEGTFVTFTVNEEGLVSRISLEGEFDVFDDAYATLAENAAMRLNACVMLCTFAFMVEEGRYTNDLVRRYAPPLLALLEEGGELLMDGCLISAGTELDAKGHFHYHCTMTIIPDEELPDPVASPTP